MVNPNSLLAYEKLDLSRGQLAVVSVFERNDEKLTMNQVSNALNRPKNAISGRFGELVAMGVLQVVGHAIENGSRVSIYELKKKREPDWQKMTRQVFERQGQTSVSGGLPF